MSSTADKTMTVITKHWLLIVVALVVIFNWKSIGKIFDGLFSPLRVAADVLSFPEDIATSLNKQMDASIKAIVYRGIMDYVKSHTYNPNSAEDKARMNSLVKMTLLTKAQRELLITEWKRPSAYKGLAQAAQSYYVNAIMQQLKNLI